MHVYATVVQSVTKVLGKTYTAELIEVVGKVCTLLKAINSLNFLYYF